MEYVIAISDGVALASGISGAILGAVAGGACTGYATYRIERGRRDHEIAQARAATVEMTRGAARVYTEDLVRAKTTAKHLLRSETWWSPGNLFRVLDHTDRRLLATSVSREGWAKLVLAQSEIDMLSTQMTARAGQTVEDGDKPFLSGMDEHLAAGLEVLNPLTKLEDAKQGFGGCQ